MSSFTPSRSKFRKTVIAAFVVTAVAAACTDAAAQVIEVQPLSGEQVSAVNMYSPAMQQRLSTSSVGLVETASQVPGGGIVVDLAGGFQNVVVATVAAGGSLRTGCARPHVDGTHAADRGGE